ncbi:MAG TPA: N-acetyl-alpha-D-glucosaminyl L-malate synthase BshA [Myxococcaceae bacterium]|nr:N-acetyl-alpha-D-glucosaminyl L-malate synthase BshA [Myxococcaceae bacterium]
MTALGVGIACFPTVGGSGVAASQLAMQLAARGHRVHVFSSAVPVRLAGDGPWTVHLVESTPRPPAGPVIRPQALARAMAEVAVGESLDLLHVHYALPHGPAALLARERLRRLGRRAPALVTTLHGTDVTGVSGEPAMRAQVRETVLGSDAVLTPSAWLRRVAVETLGLPPSARVEVLPNFVDPQTFHPLDDGAGEVPALFPDLDWSPGRRPAVLLHASNFRPVKRVGDAVRALAEVRRARVAVLVLVGDGPERGAVEALATSLGVRGAVAFAGERSSLGDLFAHADLFLLPSEQESFGLAALESLASGVPVVASDVGGVSEVVTHGETGWLVPAKDPIAMAGAVLELLAEPARRMAMGRAARASAVARFQPGPLVSRTEALYREVLARPAAGSSPGR